MTASSTDRADARGATRPRTLVCTADGVWIWPGTPLTERRGGPLVPLPAPQLYQRVATLHGPGVHGPALVRTIECAAAYLSMGRLKEATDVVAAFALPPVSFDGAALMRAIATRLGVAMPDVDIAGWPGASPPGLFEQLARVHDYKLAWALRLEPVFNPGLRRVAPANVPFDPALHPRWPAGQPDGGRFRPSDGDGAVLQVQSRAQAVRRALELLGQLLRQLRRPPKPPETIEPAPPPADKPVPKPENPPPPEAPPGIGHNRPPEDDAAPAPGEPDNTPAPGKSTAGKDRPFTLPAERPTGEGEVAQWGQRAADEIREALAKNDAKKLAEITDALAHAEWIKDQLNNIVAAQDPPRTLDELIEAAQEKGPRLGYDNHHIIEQGKQNKDIPRDIIDAPYNVVRIPRYKHWQINDYYRNPQDECGGLTPREYLKGKSVEDRYQFGLGILRKFGVLK